MTFSEYCAEQGHPYPPTKLWYPTLYQRWFRAECKAGRPPDGHKVKRRSNPWTREQMIEAAQAAQRQYGDLKNRLHEYGCGLPARSVWREEFGTWTNYLKESGLNYSNRGRRAK